MYPRPFPRRLELDQQVRAVRSTDRVVEQATQERRGEREGDVAERAPSPRRQRGSHDVVVHDVHVGMVAERSPKPLDETRVQLDRRNRARLFRERKRETSGAGADLNHVLGGADACVTNELGCDQSTAKEVLTFRPNTAGPR